MSPRRPIPAKTKSQSGLPSWLILVAVVAVAVVAVVVGADFLLKLQGPATLPPTSGVSATGRTEGSPNAPISFVEYSDFQ